MANLEVIALDTATPQLKAPQAGDGYAMPRPVTVTEVVGSTALTLTGATQTTAVPVLNATQTWNNVVTTFTGFKLNITDTASSATSLLASIQSGGVNIFGVRRAFLSGVKFDRNVLVFPQYTYTQALVGGFIAFGETENNPNIVFNIGNGAGVDLQAGSAIRWSDNASNAVSGTKDLQLTRKGAANLQLGAADAAAPVAQTIGVQSVVAGTSNTAGAAFTIRGSQGTGTGVGGSILFQTAPVGTTGTAQNPLITPLTIGGDGSISFTPPSGRAVSLSANRIFQYGAGTPEGVSFGNFTGGYGFICGPTALVCFAPVTAFAGNPDVIITRKAAATLQHGAADAAAPVAQTIGVQSVVAGTSNIAGANFTIAGSQGTGTGVGGSILFQTAPAGTAGTAQNALVTQMTIGTDGSLTLVDTPIIRDAANILAQRNGASTQTLRLYNTYTDASNYSRLFIKANNGGGNAQIGFEQAGTGAANNLWFLAPSIVFSTTAGLQRWSINSTGHFVGQTDNTYDIGASGATRPRIGYFGTRVDAPTLRTDTAYTVATLPAAGVAGRRAYVTDATAPTFLGALTGGGAVVSPVFDNGTAWVAG